MSYGMWRRYVPVAERRAQAILEMSRLRKAGKDVQPVRIEGRTIARSFWGKRWCEHLESFSDYANRLPRGRAYVRNGLVCHLEIHPGRIDAMVSGSELYEVRVRVDKLKATAWKSIKRRCSGQIGSIIELLQGRLSGGVMAVVTDRGTGLFPKPKEIGLNCTCPDWADMCKHVAAVLYGVGSRLDDSPESLFSLRGVDAAQLIDAELALPAGKATGDNTLADDDLAGIFGIDLEMEDAPDAPAKRPKKRPKSGRVAHASAKRRQPPDRGNAAATPPPKLRPSGQSVARLRRRLDLSVAEFARLLGVTAATVYRWEAASGKLKLQARPLTALGRLHLKAKAPSR